MKSIRTIVPSTEQLLRCFVSVWLGLSISSAVAQAQTCGDLGGDYCSQTGGCPGGYSSLCDSNDCSPCCRSNAPPAGPSCGDLGGNYCSQATGCPANHSSLGQSWDCRTCCRYEEPAPSPSCGSLGGDYCSQTAASCPQGYGSLGPTWDCPTCCKTGLSCGEAGGDHCSQADTCPSGYGPIGQTWDCRTCCASRGSCLPTFSDSNSSCSADETTYEMAEYWFMPHGLVANLRTIFKNGRVEVGQHSFWRGTLMGRRVALQGDPSVTRYDVFEDAGDRILYWGTLRGNAYEDGDNAFTQARNSNSFDSPFTWMLAQMKVGDERKEPVTDNNYDHQLRKAKDTQTHIFRLRVDAHYPNYTDPESALPWDDVLKVSFWSRGTEEEPDPTARETYYLAKGLGTIRFETSNEDPSGVLSQYALSFDSQAPSGPAVPWFDPFNNRSFIPNGFFEDLVLTPANEGPVSTHLRSWSGSSEDVVITRAFTNPVTGLWAIRLKVGVRGGPDVAETTGWIPVVGGATYTLSGYVRRSSSADRVYLDFSDGEGQGGRFPDGEAMATKVDEWEYVEATATVDAATTGIKVRCVRDGANAGDALCDGLTLRRN